MASLKNRLKWTRAALIPPANHLSTTRKHKEFEDFKNELSAVQYHRPNMFFLMGDEYRRQWFCKRDAYNKETYAKLEMSQLDFSIKRRYVTRMQVHPQFRDSNADTVPKKVEGKVCQRYPKTFDAMKYHRYKLECLPQTKDKKRKKNKLGREKEDIPVMQCEVTFDKSCLS